MGTLEKTRLQIIGFSLFLLIGTFLVAASEKFVRDMTLSTPDGRVIPRVDRESQPVETAPGSTAVFRCTIFETAFSMTRFLLVPDDRLVNLSVNGTNVTLPKMPPGFETGAQNEYDLELGPYLIPGVNTVGATVSNLGGPVDFRILASRKDSGRIFSLLFLGIGLAGIAWLVARKRKWPAGLVLVFIGAIVLRLWVFNATPFDTRTHDVDGHMDYIRDIIRTSAIPETGAGWETYQPALYYLGGTVWTAPFRLLFRGSVEVFQTSLMLFSLFLSLFFVFIAFEIFRFVISGKSGTDAKRANCYRDWLPRSKTPAGKIRDLPLLLSAGLLAFWPSLVMHSVRIGNDALFYPLLAASLLFTVYWYDAKKTAHLVWASIFAMLALFTKTSALVMFATIGLTLVTVAVKAGIGKYRKQLVIFAAIAVFAGTITLGPPVLRTLAGEQKNVFIGNVDGLVKDLAVKNELANYLYFDFKTYMTQPFTSPIDDNCGRQFFLNYYLKTALFGEFNFPHQISRDLATCLSLLLLLLAGCALYGGKTGWAEYAEPLRLFLLLLFVAAIYNRISLPFSCGVDFRYTLPLLIPFCLFVGRAIQEFRARKRFSAARLGTVGMLLFCCFSIWFWLAV